jgi:hypothetical protein
MANIGQYMQRINNPYLSVFDGSPRGVEPNVNSRLYSGTAPSSTATFPRAWLSTQNDFSISKTKSIIIRFQPTQLKRHKIIKISPHKNKIIKT